MKFKISRLLLACALLLRPALVHADSFERLLDRLHASIIDKAASATEWLRYEASLSSAASATSTVRINPLPKTSPVNALEEIHWRYPFIEGLLEQHHLPKQLAAVVLVESGGNPFALSPKGARGLWQLMPETARRYGLKVGDRVDERTDPVRSTYAAARYLHDLYGLFGDWSLVLAAYNFGERRVQDLTERTGTRSFSEFVQKRLLPEETTRYVPTVLRLAKWPHGEGHFSKR